MGTWQNTTYVNHGAPRRVADAMLALLQDEGMRPIARPAAREPQRYDPMQYGDALESNVWAAAVFPGAPGWTVVKTAPFELLAERAPGASRMRLSDLCGRLGAPACQVDLYDGTALILIEVDRAGRHALSGHHPQGGLRFREETIADDRIAVRFDVLPLQHLIGRSTHGGDGGAWLDNDEFIARLAGTLGCDNAGWCDNLTMVEALIPHRPLPMPGAIELYVEWPARDRVPGERLRRLADLPRRSPTTRGGA